MLDFQLFKIRLGSYTFSPKLIPTIVTLLLLYLLYSLGQWQLGRAEEKEIIRKQITERSELAPVSMDELPDSTDEKVFRHVNLKGRFTDKSFLLDNRVMNQVAGFEVVTPFKTTAGKWLLINRGWLPQVRAREVMPTFDTPEELVNLTGFIRVPHEKVFMLQEQHYDLTKWPVIIQHINIKDLSKITEQRLLPFVVFLEKDSEAGFYRNWPVFQIDSNKNISYAIQWFALFCALLMIYFLVNTKRPDDESRNK